MDMEKMKAIVYTEFGGPDVLKPKEVAKPNPKADEVLIRIHSVSVNYGDILARNFKNTSPRELNMPLLIWVFARFSFGWNKPKKNILGNAFSGEIEVVGHAVNKFKPGDRVIGHTAEHMGAMAEYLCMSENGTMTTMPAIMTFEEASAVPYGGGVALSLMKKVKIQKGQKVLIAGASGAIGSAALQLVKQYEAEVTGVCGSASTGYVKSIGANKIIDYRKEDFTKNGEVYDLIFDVLGRGTFSKYKSSLTQNGVYFSVSFKLIKLLQMLWTDITGGKKVLCALASPKQEDLISIKKLIEVGRFKSIIDKSFTLEHAAEAHRYFESGHRNGNVVIVM